MTKTRLYLWSPKMLTPTHCTLCEYATATRLHAILHDYVPYSFSFFLLKSSDVREGARGHASAFYAWLRHCFNQTCRYKDTRDWRLWIVDLHTIKIVVINQWRLVVTLEWGGSTGASLESSPFCPPPPTRDLCSLMGERAKKEDLKHGACIPLADGKKKIGKRIESHGTRDRVQGRTQGGWRAGEG